MSSLRRRTVWLVPAATIVAVAAGATLPRIASGASNPPLPAKTAQQLLADVASSGTHALSGTVVETANLGLPALPTTGPAAQLSWPALLTGSHTVQVWLDGPQRQRLAVLGQLAESDVVHNGSDLWTYTSRTNAVSHRTLPARSAPSATPEQQLTPSAAATQALAAITPTTKVSVLDTAVVAGRSTYTLRLAPADPAATTVSQVLIYVDAATSVPLKVQVYGSNPATPAFETGFTGVSFATPSAGTFTFTPPAGATVTNAGPTAPPSTPPAGAARRTVGTGWSTIAVLPPGTAAALSSGSSGALLGQLSQLQSNGDRLLSTALVNALIKPDGSVLVGAVPPAVLLKAAG